MNIKIITLDPARWQENKTLRLLALQTDPTSFARTYAEDAALPDQSWIDWLHDAQEGKSYLLFAEHNKKLVGMVGAILALEQKQATIIAFYVEPILRGKGVGRKLLIELLNRLATDTRITSYLLHVNTKATAAIALYESLGFRKIKQVPMAQHPTEYEWMMIQEKLEI